MLNAKELYKISLDHIKKEEIKFKEKEDAFNSEVEDIFKTAMETISEQVELIASEKGEFNILILNSSLVPMKYWDTDEYEIILDRIEDRISKELEENGFETEWDEVGIRISWDKSDEKKVELEQLSIDDVEKELSSTKENDRLIARKLLKECENMDSFCAKTVATGIICGLLNNLGYKQTVRAFNDLGIWCS